MEDPAIRVALDFVWVSRDDEHGFWYEEPFETLFVLEVLLRLEVPDYQEFALRAIQWLVSLQRNDGVLIGARYTGMLISVLKMAENKAEGSLALPIEKATQWLRTAILNTNSESWSNEAWSNFYPAKALLDLGYTLDDPAVAKAIQWFLNTQSPDGKWSQVAEIHDTALSIAVLSQTLECPLIELLEPRMGVLSATRTNGLIFVAFQIPGVSALKHGEKFKISSSVQAELGEQQRQLLNLSVGVRSARAFRRGPLEASSNLSESLHKYLLKIGQYTYGHLFPAKLQSLFASCDADHLLLDLDERLIDLPWELAHDGVDFLCIKFAVGRRIISDHEMPVRRAPQGDIARMLIVADPTEDLPAARAEGGRILESLKRASHLRIDYVAGRDVNKRDFLLNLKDYDLVHYAGHAFFNGDNPDESYLSLMDGRLSAFEIARFTAKKAPTVVFLNACWSAEEIAQPNLYPAMVRGLGRTFLYAGAAAFIGYLVPVPDEGASELAAAFYDNLSLGATIGESLRRARVEMLEGSGEEDGTWASAVLYGDPALAIGAVTFQG